MLKIFILKIILFMVKNKIQRDMTIMKQGKIKICISIMVIIIIKKIMAILINSVTNLII
jgi:hypothetical protein